MRESGIRKWVGRDGKLIAGCWVAGANEGGSGPEGSGRPGKGRRLKQVKTLWYLIDDGNKSVSRVQVAPQAGALNPGVIKYPLGEVTWPFWMFFHKCSVLLQIR